MTFTEKLKLFIVKEPFVFASCVIGGIGIFLPAFVKPILDSMGNADAVPQPRLSKVVAGIARKNQDTDS